MAIIDNTLASKVDTFNPATPLMQAAAIQSAQAEAQANQFKVKQAELGAEVRGLQPYLGTPEFASKWAETSDRLLQRGVLDPQTHEKWRNSPSPLLMKSIIAQTSDPSADFRKQEAMRDQANKDREFGLAERKLVASQSETKVIDQVRQRKEAASAMGLDPSKPGYESYVLTGKMPREDQQPLSATDKKAILEADEGVLAATTAIDSLKKAKELSPKAMGNPLASRIAPIGAFLGNEASQNTVDLDNTVATNALSQLKAIFGGAPTEGERKILLDIQGSSNQPDAVRQKIYDRAIIAAEKRLEFNKQRAESMRGNTFYKPTGQNRAPAAAAPGGPAVVKDKASFDALPSGSQFVAPDGSVRVKP